MTQAFMYKPYQGYYYVQYRDGQKSALMSREQAENYASIFGGVVVFDQEAATAYKQPTSVMVLNIVNILLTAAIIFSAVWLVLDSIDTAKKCRDNPGSVVHGIIFDCKNNRGAQ